MLEILSLRTNIELVLYIQRSNSEHGGPAVQSQTTRPSWFLSIAEQRKSDIKWETESQNWQGIQHHYTQEDIKIKALHTLLIVRVLTEPGNHIRTSWLQDHHHNQSSIYHIRSQVHRRRRTRNSRKDDTIAKLRMDNATLLSTFSNIGRYPSWASQLYHPADRSHNPTTTRRRTRT